MSSHAPSHTFRPTRRDLILILLTLSTSYFLLSPRTEVTPATPGYLQPIPIGSGSDTVPMTSPPGASTSKLKLIPDWLWHTTPDKACPSVEARDETFGESVRTYGFLGGGTKSIGDEGTGGFQGMPKDDWDQGNEDFPGAAAAAAAADVEVAGIGPGDRTTELLGHQPGWTLMDRVYLFAGSLYIVTEKDDEWPDLVHMTSTGKPANDEPGNAAERLPTGKEIIFITPSHATELWGSRVLKMGGTTWLFNDGQFVDHYYHFSAELLLGTWRAYASLDKSITPHGETTLSPPRRAWFMHLNATEWRDKPRFNPTVLFSAFPSISLLYPQDWEDFALMTNSTHPRAYQLERALLADRSAAFYGEYTAPTSRTVASALWVRETSPWWWEPIRRQILRTAGVPDSVVNRNLEGWGAIDPVHFMQDYTPAHAHPIGRPPLEADMDAARTSGLRAVGDYKPVVTYISRQSSRRRLNKESHEGLVLALEASRDKLDFDLHVVEAEKLSREEQFALAGKTTIMLGVHGNGLTHLLWMPATPRSAVIELYFRGGFARDYQWTAHCLGMRHFGVQHDVSYTAPALPEVVYPEGFHGTEITVDGAFVAGLIEDRLMGKI